MNPIDSHLKIGLALGSGSARGWAHFGVLRALTRCGIRPGVVCGASIGALVGAAIISVISNVIVLLGVSVYWQSAVSGIVIVLAISFSSLSAIISENKQKKLN